MTQREMAPRLKCTQRDLSFRILSLILLSILLRFASRATIAANSTAILLSPHSKRSPDVKRMPRFLNLLLAVVFICSAALPAAAATPPFAGTDAALRVSTPANSFTKGMTDPTQSLLVTFPGSYAAAAGLGADWAPDNTATQAADANNDGVWKFTTNAIPAGSYEFKATVGGSWDENYGKNGQPGGANVPFTVAKAGDTVHFYYDRSDNFVASRPDYVIPVVAGSFLEALGGQNWAPDNLKSWMKDPDGDGVYKWKAMNVPAGAWEYKVALNEGWDVAYPANNKSFTVPAGGANVTFSYNGATHEVSEMVGDAPPPALDYAVMHYARPAGDYGAPSADFNTYWGLHLWGDAIDATEVTSWTAPKAFSGVDDYGAYVAIKLQDSSKAINYIVHKGNDKDTSNDRSFNPSQIPVLWIKQGDAANYASRAAALGQTVIHYHRPDGNYEGWGLHLWGGAIDPSEATDWGAPKLPTGTDDYGAYFTIKLKDATQPVNFIVHKGDAKDPDGDRSYTPAENYQVWLQSGDAAVYKQRGAAEDYALIHYRRAKSDYTGWGLHVWTGTPLNRT